MITRFSFLTALCVLLVVLAAAFLWLRTPIDPAVDRRAFIFDHFEPGSVGAEIGVWKGDFSARVMRERRPSTLHLIDPWVHESGEEYENAGYGGDREDGQREMDTIYESVLSRFQAEIEEGSVVVHRQTSATASTSFPDEYLDWVYIDGNHLYEFVKADLELYYPKVKRGGLITGDDYVEGGWWQGGVMRALDEFLEKDLVDLIEIRAGQFVLRKR